jgi:hypothetical protein
LSRQKSYQSAYWSSGLVSSPSNLSTILSPRDVFQFAAGAESYCTDCIGVVAGSKYIIPIGTNLISSAVTGSPVIMNEKEQVLSLDTTCFSLASSDISYPNTVLGSILISIADVNYGVDSVHSSWEITSVAGDGSVKGKRCIVISKDFSGLASKRYSTTSSHISLLSVESLTYYDKKTCTNHGSICLNESLIKNSSFVIWKSAFQSTQYYISKKLSHNFPDPTDLQSDLLFAERFRSLLGLAIKATASDLGIDNVIVTSVTLNSDSAAFRMIPNDGLMILSVIMAVFTIFIGTLLILADLLKLGKTSDRFLRHLSASLDPSDRWLDDVCEYAVDHYAQNNLDWDCAPIKYGEDRSSKGELMGRLRFGGKKDVLAFRNGRKYI